MNDTGRSAPGPGVQPEPGDPNFVDEKSVRDELTRQFDVCGGCRRCVSYCTSFPNLFDRLDARPAAGAGSLTPVQQDLIVDGCFQCGRCLVGCPYRPGLHDLAVDVPHTMQRAVAMRRKTSQGAFADRRAAAFLDRTRVAGRMMRRLRRVGTALIAARPRSLRRRLVTVVTGVSPVRALPPFTGHQRSTAVAGRAAGPPAGQPVTYFAGCLVNDHAPGVVADLVDLCARIGIDCSPSVVDCCGAVSLHAGATPHFARVAARNVRALAEEATRGAIVVIEPSCARTIAEYPRFVDSAQRTAADAVRSAVTTPAMLLARSLRDHPGVLDTSITSDDRQRIMHLSGDDPPVPDDSVGYGDLLARNGSVVEISECSSGVGGFWGFRAAYDDAAALMARRVADAVGRSTNAQQNIVQPNTVPPNTVQTNTVPPTIVTGSSVLGNLAILDAIGVEVEHPISVIARACAIAPPLT